MRFAPAAGTNPSIFDGVSGRISEVIRAEGIRPGQRVPTERALAAKLGVSRTSIREGLTVLRVFGLIEIRHGDGTYLIRDVDDVVPPIAGELADHYPHLPALSAVSTQLHSLAARLAGVHRDDQDLGAMAIALAKMDSEIVAGGEGLEGDRKFHQAVVDAAHNPVLADVLNGLADGELVIARASLGRPGQPERSLTTHRLIFEAIATHDGDEAGRLMLDHLAITSEIDLGAGFEPMVGSIG